MSLRNMVVMVWDVRAGTQIRRKVLQTGEWVTTIAWSPDGERLAVGTFLGTIYLLEAETVDVVGGLEGHSGRISSLLWGCNSEHIYSTSRDGEMRVWRVGTDALACQLEECHDMVPSCTGMVCRSPLVLKQSGGSTAVRKLESGREVCRLRRDVYNVRLSPDGRHLAFSTGNHITVVEAESGRKVPRLRKLDGFSEIKKIAWSPDGVRLMGLTWAGKVEIWSVPSGRRVHSIPGPIHDATWGPSGEHVAVMYPGGALRVLEAESGQEVHVMEPHKQESMHNCMAWSPDGRYLACIYGQNSVHLWEVGSGREMFELNTDNSNTGHLAWSPDGQRIACGCADGSIRVWEVESRWMICKIEGHGAAVTGMMWNEDGTRLWSRSRDKTVRVWDVDVEACELASHHGDVAGVAWSQDGRLVAVASRGGSLRVLEVGSGRCICRLDRSGGGVASVVTRDGDGGANGNGVGEGGNGEDSKGGLVRVWDVPAVDDAGDGAADDVQALRVAWSKDGRHVVSLCGGRPVAVEVASGEVHWDLVGVSLETRSSVVLGQRHLFLGKAVDVRCLAVYGPRCLAGYGRRCLPEFRPQCSMEESWADVLRPVWRMWMWNKAAYIVMRMLNCVMEHGKHG